MLSVIGLALLLLLAGVEVALERWRGRFLVLVGPAFLLLLGLVVLVGFGRYLAGQGVSPVLIAIILVATARGSVVPLLENGDKSAADFGQLIITGAMVAEFDSIILLSLCFI
jgi:Kef-type K+ transport system membrane component KefB